MAVQPSLLAHPAALGACAVACFTVFVLNSLLCYQNAHSFNTALARMLPRAVAQSGGQGGGVDWVVLTTVNEGFYDFFENWHANYKLLGLSSSSSPPSKRKQMWGPMKVYVVAEDRATEAKLLERNHPGVVVERGFLPEARHDAKNSTGKALRYGTREYNMMMLGRTQHVLRHLQDMGENVIFTDVDAIWRRDPRPFFTAPPGTDGKMPDVWFQKEKGSLATACAGFFAIRSNNATIDFVGRWVQANQLVKSGGWRRGRRGGGGGGSGRMHDQDVLNFLLKDNEARRGDSDYAVSGGAMQTAFLSSLYFPVGVVYYEIMLEDERQQVAVVHFNWLVGSSKKRLRMMEHDMWLAA